MNNKICSVAVLITCHNRKTKTINCLCSLYSQNAISNINIVTFLVDDNSTDGTSTAVKELFPNVNLIQGDGNLFWSGGMRLAFEMAVKSEINFDFYLLLNDDTILFPTALEELFMDYLSIDDKKVIIIGSTKGANPIISEFTYGGRVLKNKYNSSSKIILPNAKSVQKCDLGNGNIMLIPKLVTDTIGLFSDYYTHGISDFEYTLRAKRNGIITYVSRNYLGICDIPYDAVEWKSADKHNLKERINYLYSVKGLSYREYLHYIRNYFPFYFPQAWLQLWLKTLFPIIWEKFRKNVRK